MDLGIRGGSFTLADQTGHHMVRLKRKRRILKRAGLLLVVSTVALGFHSVFYSLQVTLILRGVANLQVTSLWGNVGFAWPTSSVSSGFSVRCFDNGGSTFLKQGGGQFIADLVFSWPRYHKRPSKAQPAHYVTTVILPLWMFMLLFAVPAAWLWWIDRKRVPPGCCHKCGYNLTGNVSGVCPECGQKVKAVEGE